MSKTVEYQGAALFTLFVITWEYVRRYKQAKFYEKSYWGERRGRTRVEQEMKKLAEVQLNTSEGFFVQPVGIIESCFRQCVGTPRQGMLVPKSRATLKLTSNMSPECLDGIEEFSHIWLYFKFHLNTNTLKEAKAFSGAINDNRKYTFSAKVTPPMLKQKKGVLATRSPHRPNPIGITLAKIERVDKNKRIVYLSACDLVDGTPVLDAKPYVADYDAVHENYRVPSWIVETIETRNTVTVMSNVSEDIQKIQRKLKQYKNEPQEFLEALIETLSADVRSKFQTKRRIEDAIDLKPCQVPFDEAIVNFLWKDDRILEITSVMLAGDMRETLLLEDEKS